MKEDEGQYVDGTVAVVQCMIEPPHVQNMSEVVKIASL